MAVEVKRAQKCLAAAQDRHLHMLPESGVMSFSV